MGERKGREGGEGEGERQKLTRGQQSGGLDGDLELAPADGHEFVQHVDDDRAQEEVAPERVLHQATCPQTHS